MEKVSIIIPTYNRADVLVTSIQSVLQQSYTDFELLIVDDGSTDNTDIVVESIHDDRIRYLKMPENKGVAAARNEGIRQAKYDYIAFQDSDDHWKPEKLEKQMACLTQKPACSTVLMNARRPTAPPFLCLITTSRRKKSREISTAICCFGIRSVLPAYCCADNALKNPDFSVKL